ncbi:anticodon nuclease [Rosenbergiella nectarea]|uniref:anticodon nuclease n=1 Tax=Rosenbergiella nectarea TaxID=988801 RepID=UPI001F4EB34C|nr:anticodon nuclease [Rosenbergiella nectarea]
MSKTLTELAQQLRETNKKVQLIYAFNGTGKTRLSREFTQLIARQPLEDEGVVAEDAARHKILYYNAYTEDLFVWDNGAEPKLKIQPNTFTDWILNEQGQDQNIINYFQHFSTGKLTPRFNPEYAIKNDNDEEIRVKAFTEVTFSLQRGNDEYSNNIKISKGEESHFIWSIFYTLLDLVIGIANVPEPSDRESNQFDHLKYVYIDDPVSSLDENHLIELAVGLATLIKSSFYSTVSGEGIKFIISTHSAIFYNVLYNELGIKSGLILSQFDDGTYQLEEKKGDSNKSFSYHLHIKNNIKKAIEQRSVQRYHFALLRNLYEKTANFLGYEKWSDLLPGDKSAYAKRIMNFYPHNTLSNEEIAEPTEPEKEMVKYLLDNLNNYGYLTQKVKNDAL